MSQPTSPQRGRGRRRAPIGTRKPGPPRGRSRPGLDHDGQRIPRKYDAYLVRASATPLLAAARVSPFAKKRFVDHTVYDMTIG
jgi:hypothetical protein